ncbi:MAG: 16S rRNA (guanine(527)-N(7))-methyltransferase RsmG [Pirellulaceae bacterium]|nr:16S rRNA (guanine(527)-N(7))-methyltransferase RsmG [Pirellulaceae bacterium]
MDEKSELSQPSSSLIEAITPYELPLADVQIGQVETYIQELWRWNEKLNLTRHTNYDLFVARDLLDGWHLSRQLKEGEEVLDIGSGGGVPGILLAILRPDLVVSLCDSSGKKTKVLEAIVKKLKLPVPVYHGRAERQLDDFRYDTLTARAVGPVWKLLTWLEPHWVSFDRILTLKGPRWEEERKEARHRNLTASLELRKIASYPMPKTDSESVILQIKRK